MFIGFICSDIVECMWFNYNFYRYYVVEAVFSDVMGKSKDYRYKSIVEGRDDKCIH